MGKFQLMDHIFIYVLITFCDLTMLIRVDRHVLLIDSHPACQYCIAVKCCCKHLNCLWLDKDPDPNLSPIFSHFFFLLFFEEGKGNQDSETQISKITQLVVTIIDPNQVIFPLIILDSLPLSSSNTYILSLCIKILITQN